MPRSLPSAFSGRLLLPLLVAACVAPASFQRESPSASTAPVFPQETPALGNPGVAARGAWGRRPAGVELRLPSVATEAAEVRSAAAAIAFRLAGARPAPVRSVGEEARYEGALGEGTELVLRPREDGVEDLVRFERRPEREAVEYLVDVRRVAGLRRVGGVVEFLDEGGAPRLRMEAPYVVGARGEVVEARVVVGCAHD